MFLPTLPEPEATLPNLKLDDAVVDKLSEVGFDPVYGARPLKRSIQEMLENGLAQDVLSGKFPAGSTIQASLVGDRVKFELV